MSSNQDFNFVKQLIDRTNSRDLRWTKTEEDDRYCRDGSYPKKWYKTTYKGIAVEIEQRLYEGDGYGLGSGHTLSITKGNVTTPVPATENDLYNLWNTIERQPKDELLDEFKTKLRGEL